MFYIYVDEGQLRLDYSTDRDFNWVAAELKRRRKVTISKVFHFSLADLIGDVPEFLTREQLDQPDFEEPTYTFKMGTADDRYFTINRSVLRTKHDVLITRARTLERKHFAAFRDISIFRKIDDLVRQQIVIGGSRVDAIPLEDFDNLLNRFPTSTELTKYASSRIENILKEHVGTPSNAQEKYQKYLDKHAASRKRPRQNAEMYAMDVEKFTFIRDQIAEMLASEKGYSEKDWQRLMVDFLLVIFPQYVTVLENVQIKDFYSIPDKVRDRYIDFALVDASGNLDVVEIKKPSEDGLITSGQYRDNYAPRHSLSGTIMQTEKYLMYLSKWGVDGEQTLTKRYRSQLPNNLGIKVTSPKGLVISGRSYAFDQGQRFDFDIIRRKYANIVDIVTYDDLLKRLDNVIAFFSRRSTENRY